MKKKRAKSRPVKKTSKSRKSVKYNSGFLPYLVSGLVTLVILFLFINYYNAVRNPNVLGISSVLARGGDDSGSSGGDDHGGDSGSSGGSSSTGSGSSGNSGGSGSSGSSGSTSGENHEGFSSSSTNNQNTTVGSSTTVECVGPDGKTFKTSFHDCQELNSKWGKNSFEFKQISEQHVSSQNTLVPPPAKKETEHIEKKIEKKEIEMQENELENEDDIHLNSATNSSGFIVRHKGVEAETENELEHDPEATSSNQLLLTTPSGKHHILVLPDEAIQKVLEHNKLTEIFDEDGASVSADLAKIKLTVKNDKAVFEVKGIKKEKFLGFIPVDLHKTAEVSAETGDVTSFSDSFIGGLLDALSF